MAVVDEYTVWFYGIKAGGTRAQIVLLSGSTTLGYVRFYDEGKKIPPDSESKKGIFKMNLPLSMLGPVIDVLRHEEPVAGAFSAGKACLTTSAEPVGEGE